MFTGYSQCLLDRSYSDKLFITQSKSLVVDNDENTILHFMTPPRVASNNAILLRVTLMIRSAAVYLEL